ncbi:Solute carrier family 35 member E3 [Porphyridium purpureum]|uniref:Solute carrier family 35 member E3 n=1 Tax=Porphyridium purpureum TaxID=35688 RepID=A0A5J4YMT8_PORPP|nr:Solute carrier family 35 member E3 [Porphyridium purpureum]|eukprot:POR9565..scf244_11
MVSEETGEAGSERERERERESWTEKGESGEGGRVPGGRKKVAIMASTPLTNLKRNLAAADWKVASFMLLNFASSTGIVVSNKYVMDALGFKFATSLTFLHFVMTFLMLALVRLFSGFEIKRLPVAKVAKLAAGNMGFVVLTNLSLQYNSIGFYQIMKVMTTPTVVFLEAVFYQKYLENNLKLSLVPVCLGVILTSVSDYRLNMIGTIYAVAGVIVTSLYQIWSGTLQKSLDCSALQLQFYTAPLSALFILPVMPLLDNYSFTSPGAIWNYDFAMPNVMAICATGLIAFLVNISIFLIIGKSSPLTYNILGHGKTCFILMTDFLFFGRPVDTQGTAGIASAMVGVFWYTHLKLEKARIEKEATQVSKEEVDPEKGSVSESTAPEVKQQN